jgi:NAD(P)-dependent dehydrogenase (short-subunit alcohol dehydrogenase family)
VRLAGKVALVTGTSPNIGGAIAEGMAAEGAKVVCADRRPDNAEQCAAAIKGAGGDSFAVVCDVTDESEVSAMVASARERFGGLDILVNNAVRFNQKGLTEMPFEEWRQQLSVILDGAFLCSQQAARIMVEQGRGGCIINIASTAAHQGQPGNIGYCTGKSGILNFTRAAAMDLATYNIRVNSLTPTATDTDEAGDRAVAWGRERGPSYAAGMEHFRRAIPMGRLPSPRHYAKAAVFLASDDAEMITGFDLRVDAGAVAKYWPWMPELNKIGTDA